MATINLSPNAPVILLGDAELMQRLTELEARSQRKIVRKAIMAALVPTLWTAKANAPLATGKLMESVKLKAFKRSRSRIGARVTTGLADSDFGGKTYYGAFQEFGWKAGRRSLGVRRAQALLLRGALRRTEAWFRSRRKAAQTAAKAATSADKRRQIPGTRFMKRAADSTKATAAEIFRREFNAAFEKEVARLARAARKKAQG